MLLSQDRGVLLGSRERQAWLAYLLCPERIQLAHRELNSLHLEVVKDSIVPMDGSAVGGLAPLNWPLSTLTRSPT